ncbi:MAG: 4,5-DOPA dioxygenase extradiol [Bacteroidetes bacterium]|nr:4,5-DOPA dioxygenase extradiol [Bacteroidota bacterium]
MDRKAFIKSMAFLPLAASFMNLRDLSKISDGLPKTEKMPVLFIGHGSPMNAIEDNEFTLRWKQLAKEIPQPAAVLCISAHWLTKGTFITAMDHPETIHDFGGFPQQLFDVQYPAPGNPQLAKETKELIKSTEVGLDHEWGLDHGTWSIIKQMYPEANIPVLQLSIDYYKTPQYHYNLAKELAALRNKGVLIVGSGNMVHNLGMVDFKRLNEPAGFGFDWALEMNEIFKKNISRRNHAALIDYQNLSKAATLAIPTPDHYYPLLYTLGLQDEKEATSFFNDKAMAGSLTMTSVKIG